MPETEDREVLPVERLMLLLEERATAVALLREALVLRLMLLAAEREVLLRVALEAEEREVLLRDERDTSDGASRSEDRVAAERVVDCRPEREYG